MSTTRNFNSMLNEYLAVDLLKQEFLQRDWLLSNVEKDEGWAAGNLIVPFKGAQATSLKFGGLTGEADVSEYKYVRGTIAAIPEVWATLKFQHSDLMFHGKISEKNFLKMLPDQIDEMMDYFKMVVSMHLLSGPHFAKVTVSGTVGGVLGVDKIDRFQIDQKAVLIDGNTAQVDVYVIGIDIDNSKITVSATRGGAALDVSAYTVGQNAKLYHDGVLVGGVVTNAMSSLIDMLLSAANGGSASLYGVSKLSYPYLQAINVDGSTVSATNILDKLFDGYTTVRTKARGNANKILMSFKHLGSIMKLIETQKGGFKVTPTQTKASQYGWTEIEITSVKGTLTLIGIQEMSDAEIIYLDLAALKFYSNGMFKKRVNPDGNQYFELRTSAGYAYLLDICLFGDLVLLKPGNCGIMYGISY